MDDLTDSIKVRWVRRRGDYVGHYAHSSVAGIQPVWLEFANLSRTLAGWTLTAVYLRVYDTVDFPLLREAKASAREGLLKHLRGHQQRVVRSAGARPISGEENNSNKGKSP